MVTQIVKHALGILVVLIPVYVVTVRIIRSVEVVRKIAVSNQEKLANIITQLGGIQSHLNKGLSEVTAEIARLRANAGEDLDFGPLERLVESLQVGTTALDDIVPDQVEPEEGPEEESEEGSAPEVPSVPSTPDSEPAPGTPEDAEDDFEPAGPATVSETPNE